MKKVLLILALLFCIPAFAIEIDYTKGGKIENKVPEIGFRLLNANKIPYRMVFQVVKSKQINAYTKGSVNLIVIYDEFLKYIENEDELAAILAHEISHGVDARQGVFNGAFSNWSYAFNPKKYEYKADKRAIDYLVKAGYNPVAFITIMNRIAPQNRSDRGLSHPLTSKRLAQAYECIYTKYPQYLVNNEYKDNIYYQNFLLTSRENRQKFEQKVKNNSKGKVNYL